MPHEQYGITLSSLDTCIVTNAVSLAAKAISAPLELVKIRQQTRVVDTELYETLRMCATEGMLMHLARMMRCSLQRLAANVLFTSKLKPRIKRALGDAKDPVGSPAHFAKVVLYSGVYASITSIILLPLDFALTRQMVTGRPVDVEFTSRAYSTFGLTVCGAVAYRAAYYILHCNFKDVGKEVTKNSTLVNFLRTFAIVQAAALVTYPFDTLRRRTMLRAAASSADGGASGDADGGPGGGISAVLADVRSSESPLRDLYRGVWANVARSSSFMTVLAGLKNAEKLYCRSVYAKEVSFYFYKKNRKRHERRARKRAQRVKAQAQALAQAQAQAAAAAAAAQQQANALNNTP